MINQSFHLTTWRLLDFNWLNFIWMSMKWICVFLRCKSTKVRDIFVKICICIFVKLDMKTLFKRFLFKINELSNSFHIITFYEKRKKKCFIRIYSLHKLLVWVCSKYSISKSLLVSKSCRESPVCLNTVFIDRDPTF